MEERIFVLSALLEDANALPAAYTDVFDNEKDVTEKNKRYGKKT